MTTNRTTELGNGDAAPTVGGREESVEVVRVWRQTRQAKSGWEGERRVETGWERGRERCDHLVRKPLGLLSQLSRRRDWLGQGNKRWRVGYGHVRRHAEPGCGRWVIDGHIAVVSFF